MGREGEGRGEERGGKGRGGEGTGGEGRKKVLVDDKKRSENSVMFNTDWVIFSVVYTFSYIIKAWILVKKRKRKKEKTCPRLTSGFCLLCHNSVWK